MLSQHAVKGGPAVPAARHAVKLGRVTAPKRPLVTRQVARCQASRPILPQEVGKVVTSRKAEARARSNVQRLSKRDITTKATSSASYGSSDSSKASLAPVLVAVAIASLGALLFGLHVAIVNGLQDAVSSELGFSANTGLRGAVRLSCMSLASLTGY